MKRSSRVFLAAFSILLLVSSGSILVADEGVKTLTLQGDLVRVNADSHMLYVRGSDQKEMEFSYSDKTEITGITETTEGLAGQTGRMVTVHYRAEGSSNIAVKVEVHPKQGY